MHFLGKDIVGQFTRFGFVTSGSEFGALAGVVFGLVEEVVGAVDDDAVGRERGVFGGALGDEIGEVDTALFEDAELVVDVGEMVQELFEFGAGDEGVVALLVADA